LAPVQGYSLALMIAYAFGTLCLIVISDRQTSREKRRGRRSVSLGAVHHIRLPSRWLAKPGCLQKAGADALPALQAAGIDARTQACGGRLRLSPTWLLWGIPYRASTRSAALLSNTS